MNRDQVVRVFGAVVFAAGMARPVLATTATSMSSFEGEEEPTDIVHSNGSITGGDSFDNMTNPASGDFKFYLRFNSSWWDGDRSTGNTDRQRAEVKGLGVHQKNGETFDYSETWKTNRGGSGSFWHVFQLKATDGDNGAPVIVNGIQSSTAAAVRYWPADSAIVARSYSYSVNSFTRLVMRIKCSTSASGSVQASINGDSLQGKTGVVVSRTGTTDYRPKWGSYRGVSSSSPYGNDTIEHTNVTANKVTSTSTPTPTPAPTSTPTATPTPGATATPTPGGGTFSGYYKLIEQATGKALVVQSASTSNSASVVLYDYSTGTTTNDEWQLSSLGTGYYRIINRWSGRDMVVASASTSSGANIIQYTFGGTATNDEWTMVDSGSGYFEIRNHNSGKNVQAMGTTNGSAVQQQTDDNAGDQRYLFVSIP
jgi:hypothetical protein